jgi:hypothetical protein
MKVSAVLVFAVMAFQAHAAFDTQTTKTDIKQEGGKGGKSGDIKQDGGNGGSAAKSVRAFVAKNIMALLLTTSLDKDC